MEIILLQDISDSETKEQILSLYKKHNKTLYYSDICNELCLDIKQVVRVCDELEEEGKLELDSTISDEKEKEDGFDRNNTTHV